VQWVRDTVLILACIIKSPKLARFFEFFGCFQCCLGIAALIILHVYRFKPSGKYCSSDYLDSTGRSNFIDDYNTAKSNGFTPITGQYFRGRFLLGLVIYIWCGGFFLCCVSCVFSIIHNKKHP